MRPTRYVADFDSTTGMLNALAASLEERQWPLVGILPPALLPVLRPLGRLVDAAPVGLREQIWAWSGLLEALPEERTGEVNGDEVAQWFVERYSDGLQYPAIMLGSANGALIHLAAALRIPWLPQNFLLPVRHRGAAQVDEPETAIEWAREPAGRLLEANPDLVLHQMHDPVQDRPMLRHMAFFRLKRLSLGAAYRRFIERTLAPGGTIFIVDCTRRWPALTVQPRHIFQFGGMGAVTPEEYVEGSPRLSDFLRRYGSRRTSWEPPRADGDHPEGEWGFDERILDDVDQLARARGYRVRRVSFTEPEDVSPLVADLYRWWYERRGVPTDRLLVDSFLLMEPFLTLRSGSVPFWLKFTTDYSADRLERYLDAAPTFRHIDLLLFQHGVRSAGLASVERWRALLRRAGRSARFVALKPERHPSSVSTYIRYADSLERGAPQRALPRRIELAELDAFLARGGEAYDVSWQEGARPAEELVPA